MLNGSIFHQAVIISKFQSLFQLMNSSVLFSVDRVPTCQTDALDTPQDPLWQEKQQQLMCLACVSFNLIWQKEA